jgi:hypothetical protein
MKNCTIEGCNKPVHAKGLCNAHYHRKWHGKDVSAPFLVKVSLEQKLEFIKTVVLKHESDECLPWPFTKNPAGYGTMHLDGDNSTIVSRFVCEKVNGPPPTPQHQAAHSCGKGHEACVNPRHLSWKTRKENTADAFTHGTFAIGERHPNTSLTQKDSDEIRELKGKFSLKEIAEIYSVSLSTISNIHTGKTWKRR